MKDGKVLSERYRVICRIGRGGTSTVYKVEDRLLHKTWALKIFSDETAYDEIFEREIRLLCRLNHPGLPRVADIVETQEGRGIVMDLLEGDTLDHMKGPHGYDFPEEQILKWGCQLCDILEYLHSREPPIIYGDLKPANILLRPDGNIMLLDLGISRSMITPFYAAPEQLEKEKELTPQTDLYGLGKTLEVLSGKRKSVRKTPVTELIAHLTDPDPLQRGQSAAEVRSSIRKILNGNLLEQDEEKPLQKNFAKPIILFLMLILPVLAVGTVYFQNSSQKQKKKAPAAQMDGGVSDSRRTLSEESEKAAPNGTQGKVLKRKISDLMEEPSGQRDDKMLAALLAQWRQLLESGRNRDRTTAGENYQVARDERECAEYYLTYEEELKNEAQIPETEAEGLLLDAEKRLNEAEDGDPDISANLISKENITVLSLLLTLYQRNGRTEQALKVTDRLLLLESKAGSFYSEKEATGSPRLNRSPCSLKELHMIRLNLLLDADRHDEAYQEFERLIHAYPNELKSYLSMMSYDYRTGRLDEAVKLYHLAEKRGDISQNPDFKAMKTKLQNEGAM